MRLLQVVVALAVLAVAGLSAYAYFGDMTPERREMRVPVSLTGEPLPDAPPTEGADATAAPEADGPDEGPPQAEASTAAEAPAAGANGLD